MGLHTMESIRATGGRFGLGRMGVRFGLGRMGVRFGLGRMGVRFGLGRMGVRETRADIARPPTKVLAVSEGRHRHGP